MNAERWHRIDELFAAALELDASARENFLDEQCANDAALRAEIESMLAYARASADFLERPATAETTAVWLDESRRETVPPPRAIDGARFIPGDVVAGRYRIASLLGRGGMGEVYRADDLKLHQPVALKFLAESLATSGAALARFHREVSLARQISHRHVCRVYDIGEHAGMHFLSMEYVRGEELSSLLKRIGRLPFDKAVESARQLCAGLAAIHAAGVLHRDLKPANVMLDEQGNVRITDFGIAALSEGVAGAEAMIGTPAYMSPEQLGGDELTTRSDVYALGLVLYEMFTGKRPFAGTTLPEIARERLGDTAPTHPSESLPGLDAAVARVILRCLERDPQRRPATALQVAAALPGGDPLAAALAAGETPSPQMVAAAATVGSLRAMHAVLLLAAIFAGMVLIAFGSRMSLHRLVPLDLPPDVLRARAADIARDAGQTAHRAHTAAGFRTDPRAIEYMEKHDRWERLRSAPLPVIYFWYRSSVRPFVPYGTSGVDERDPPAMLAGMVTMRLDPEGRLLYFEAVPAQEEPPSGATATTDWNRFFERAGWPSKAFRPAASRWTPPHHSDARFAWLGADPQRPDLPLRIEAASYRGTPVYFEIVWPWQKAGRDADASRAAPFFVVGLVFYFGAMALAAMLAWRNLRLGRGDRRGAFRLVLFVLCTRLLFLIAGVHHVPTAREVYIVIDGLAWGVYWGALIGLLYLALEPFVRRRWPEALISWSRLLAGDVRDPLVGRDALIGGVFGIAALLGLHLYSLVPRLLGQPAAPSFNSALLYTTGLNGARGFLPLLLDQTAASILLPLIITAVLLFFAMFTRRNAVAAAASWLAFYAVLNLNFGNHSPVAYVIALILPTLLIVALTRFGLLTLVAMFFFMHLRAFYPVTTDLTAWYAAAFLLEAAVLTIIALAAFRVALAGQPLFADSLLDG